MHLHKNTTVSGESSQRKSLGASYNDPPKMKIEERITNRKADNFILVEKNKKKSSKYR